MEKNLTEAIKNYRIERLMTQSDLAEILGVSVVTVSKMEKPGAYKWTDLTVARILNKLPGLRTYVLRELGDRTV